MTRVSVFNVAGILHLIHTGEVWKVSAWVPKYSLSINQERLTNKECTYFVKSDLEVSTNSAYARIFTRSNERA